LEDSLTLDELMLLYKEVGLRDWELQRIIFGAAGADLPNPFEGPKDRLTVEDIRRRAMGDGHNDVIDMNDPEIQFEYEVE